MPFRTYYPVRQSAMLASDVPEVLLGLRFLCIAACEPHTCTGDQGTDCTKDSNTCSTGHWQVRGVPLDVVDLGHEGNFVIPFVFTSLCDVVTGEVDLRDVFLRKFVSRWSLGFFQAELLGLRCFLVAPRLLAEVHW